MLTLQYDLGIIESSVKIFMFICLVSGVVRSDLSVLFLFTHAHRTGHKRWRLEAERRRGTSPLLAHNHPVPSWTLIKKAMPRSESLEYMLVSAWQTPTHMTTRMC